MKNITLLIILSISLFGSSIKLIDPKEAIRLIGNKKVVFISGDSSDVFHNHHILDSINMYAYDLHYLGNKPLYNCKSKAKEYIHNKGISSNKLIIVYDTLYGYNAMGVYSFFRSLNYTDVKVLNGNIDTIKALDPNQKVFDKLTNELNSIDKDSKSAQEEISSLKAKMEMIKPQLLIQNN